MEKMNTDGHLHSSISLTLLHDDKNKLTFFANSSSQYQPS